MDYSRQIMLPSGQMIAELLKHGWQVERSNIITYIRLSKDGFSHDISAREISPDEFVSMMMWYSDCVRKPKPDKGS